MNNHHAGAYGTSGSATVFAYGHDFAATNLTVSNDFDESSVTSGQQAVAQALTAVGPAAPMAHHCGWRTISRASTSPAGA